ncbi:MFS transporter [Geodermatophilus sp. DSM 44513]|uniref:MFS transporter n=1 Tax=Geodermatophilus sp. DSM 44513 TaxID=1528104 RepID=UPI0012745C2F|nr:MFS transporter [Geodermatophilus sp. DSM 44513]WNV77818.1 MFS transporter [Geodermatophilus sp. DSM 44513]
MRTTTSRRAATGAYAGMVVVAGGSMVVFPLFPALQDRLGLSTAALGLVAAAGFLAALVVELTLAPQADRGHGRSMAVVAALLVAASLAWSAVAAEAWQLVAARALGGAGLGLFSPAAAGLLIRRAPERSGEALGRLSTAELGGLAVGPMLAAVALRWTEPGTVFAGAAAVSAVTAVVVGVLLGGEQRPAPGHRPPALAFDLLRHRRVLGAVLLAVAVMVPVGAYDAIWPRYLADLGADPLLIGLSYLLFALPFMVVAAPAGRLADRVGGPVAFTRGTAVLVPFIALYAVVTDPWVATVAGVAESTVQALALVGAVATMAQAVDPSRAGSGQGLARAAGLVAATAVAAASGAVYALGGPLLLFLGTAVAVVLVSLAAWPLLRRGRTAPDGVRAVPAATAGPAVARAERSR